MSEQDSVQPVKGPLTCPVCRRVPTPCCGPRSKCHWEQCSEHGFKVDRRNGRFFVAPQPQKGEA